ncbi:MULTISPECIES: low-specificity L-threonine aldolase [unclassified Shewanella]|uniref:low-specificity L-threonine aldolase n=1 Tax=unclassified Shewanella TaxID=196818 RepID=UPI001BBF1B16|nr:MULTISPECIES: low-specificity L-threonine aldolase [unclassified Shewanella]GIU10755.1 threonine aldolase [Shewanella sp. MBTL60-112-B1]GIU32880.1 threonine aldolase [Shewanella sp. MBTL60-112-B2]
MAGVIDLRSDTVTQPCLNMRALMTEAQTGDDVYGEDPSVKQLESYAAELLNKQAAVFCPSGTQSNLMGLLSHCGRGDEYIVGSAAHTYLYEGGGAAVLGSIQPQPLTLQADASMDLCELEKAIKPKDVHYARTKLICLENTHGGLPLPDGYTQAVNAIAQRHGLSMHLDGARLFNAVVDGNTSAAALTADFDSVSICLSKGLGAPVGSLLVGSNKFIDEARHWRKMLGGGMRQAGMIAAAGLYALQNNINRLSDDHRRASELASALGQIDGVSIPLGQANTNMLYVSVSQAMRERLAERAANYNILLPSGEQMRLVTHLNINDDDLKAIIELFQQAA